MSEHYHMRYMKQHQERSCIFIFHMCPNTKEVLAILLLRKLVIFDQKCMSIQESSQVQVNRFLFRIIISLYFALLKERGYYVSRRYYLSQRELKKLSHPGLLIYFWFIQEVQLEYGTQHIRLASLCSILRLTEH